MARTKKCSETQKMFINFKNMFINFKIFMNIKNVAIFLKKELKIYKYLDKRES